MVLSQLPASIGPVPLTLFRPGRKEELSLAPGPLRGLRSEHEPRLPGAFHLWIILEYVCVSCFCYSGGEGRGAASSAVAPGTEQEQRGGESPWWAKTPVTSIFKTPGQLCCVELVKFTPLSLSVKQHLVMFSFFWLLENWGDTGQVYPWDEVCCPLPRATFCPSVVNAVILCPLLPSAPGVTGPSRLAGCRWSPSIWARTWELASSEHSSFLCSAIPGPHVVPNTKFMSPNVGAH